MQDYTLACCFGRALSSWPQAVVRAQAKTSEKVPSSGSIKTACRRWTIKLSSMTILAVALAMSVAVPPAFAQIPSWGVDTFQAPADRRWSAIAAQDVEAAFQLLRDNHPGAAPELHDLAFQQRLNSAHVLALSRA